MKSPIAPPTVLRGRVAKGVVVLDEPAALPDGTEVRVTPIRRKTLAERLKNVIGSVKNMPSDLAANHDHYLHGTPKR